MSSQWYMSFFLIFEKCYAFGEKAYCLCRRKKIYFADCDDKVGVFLNFPKFSLSCVFGWQMHYRLLGKRKDLRDAFAVEMERKLKVCAKALFESVDTW
jgi:hypothetical protein